MQAIGPFLVHLPHSSQPDQTELHWCYMVYDDEHETWRTFTALMEGKTLLTFNQYTFTENRSIPNKIQVAARAYQGKLVWESTCMAVQKSKICVYTPDAEAPIWYYIADAGERAGVTNIPYAAEVGITADDFDKWPVTDTNIISSYNQTFSDYIDRAKKACTFGVDWVFNPSKHELEDRIFFHFRLLEHLETTPDDYDTYARIWFNGERRSFEHFLQPTQLVVDLERKSNDEFLTLLSTFDDAYYWKNYPIKNIAQFVQKFSPEKAQIFVKMPVVQARIAESLSDNMLNIKLFSECNLAVFRTILNFSAVTDLLRSQIQSAAAFNAVCKQKHAKKSYLIEALTLQERCEIVHTIGIDKVKTWMTDAESMSLLRENTTQDIFSQLIWDNVVKFAETVSHSFTLSGNIVMFFANTTHTETEIIQKVTEFIDALPAKQAEEWLSNEGAYRSLIDSRTISPAQKIAFFKIPRVYASITAACFMHIMNEGGPTLEKVTLFDGLFPEKIRFFILETGGEVVRCMSPAQQVRARDLFTAKELHNLPFLFKHMSGPAAPIQPRMQPSLFMKIMTHRATPYVAALILLAGVALFLTAHTVAAAGCAVAGGLLLFGSFMYRQERGLWNAPSVNDVNAQRVYR